MESQSKVFESNISVLKLDTVLTNRASEVPKEVRNDTDLKSYSFFKVEEITFADKAPRKEALENVISSMNFVGINFVYLILGNSDGVSFYYGVAKDAYTDQKVAEITEIGDTILKANLQGNFRGSKIRGLDKSGKKDLEKTINEFAHTSFLDGVPAINQDDEDFQGVDRIVDVMAGDEFALLLIAHPLTEEQIFEVKRNAIELYNYLVPNSKFNYQQSSGSNEGVSNNKGTSVTKTEQSSDTKNDNHTVNKSEAEGKSTGVTETKTNGFTTTTSDSNGATNTKGTTENHSWNSNKDSHGTNESKSKSNTHTNSVSNNESNSFGKSATTNKTTTVSVGDSTGNSHTDGTSIAKGTSETSGTQSGTNKGQSLSVEYTNKAFAEKIKYLDDNLFPKLDYGIGKGLFNVTFSLMANNNLVLKKLETTIRSVYAAESGNMASFKSYIAGPTVTDAIQKFQVPRFNVSIPDARSQVAYNKFIEPDCFYLANLMSSKELSLIAGLPQKEVVGLALREEVDFGLNVKKADNSIRLGNLVQSGVELEKQPVFFSKDYFDRHIFVTGVTGSGKTTTCQRLLLESGMDGFLVIEPAKTEYRVLTEQFPDLLVFTLGKEDCAPFRLNPFEFFEGENITSRVDMIKASLEAAFDMEAAIPQLMSSAILKCYEDKGWNISTNRNRRFVDPYSGSVDAFPTLSDLKQRCKEVVDSQGFDDRLKDEYLGTINALLEGLLRGSNGLMLDTKHSIDFIKLLDRKVVFELENIRSGTEKSLVMGFILSHLTEAIKKKFRDTNRKVRHITLVEEAHRLLSKFEPGDSNNKKNGVEIFADMLAEIRKYGESLIIADQIPNKLTPEVLKNTNTKIVHKIFALDDKDAIGNTMALKDTQKDFLSYLEPGRCVMIFPGLNKAIQVQIQRSDDNDTSRPPTTDEQLRKRILQFYADNYKDGVIPELVNCENQPAPDDVDFVWSYLADFKECYKACIKNEGGVRTFAVDDILRDIVRDLDSRQTRDQWLRIFIENAFTDDVGIAERMDLISRILSGEEVPSKKKGKLNNINY